ncbi:MAG: hypothetical protein RJA22_750 [Verrucomicrobiota bacterium]|jgi:subtilisin-like proprotein convertase family protein
MIEPPRPRLRRALRAGVALLCLAATTVTAQLVGPNRNATRMAGDKTEPAVAIDPTNPTRAVLAANVQDGNGLFVAYSTDGGNTWTPVDAVDRVIADGGDGLPESCCDASVSLAADRYGNFFLVYLKTAAPSGIVVLLSTNGGQGFRHYATLAPGHAAGQPTVAAGCDPGCANAAVWVTYSDTAQAGTPVVAHGARVLGLGNVLPFSGAQAVPASAGGNFGDLALGPQGQVAVAFQTTGTNHGPSLIYTALDPDGLGAAGFGTPGLAAVSGVGDGESIPAQPTRGIDAAAGLAYDRWSGRLFLVYVDQAGTGSGTTDVVVRHSDNHGASWSAARRVNNDLTGRSHFLPRIACDPVTGFAAIAWLDAREDAGDGSPADRTPGTNNDVRLFLASSLDGGLTWSPNLRVSEGVSAAAASMNWNNFGEYLALAYQGGTAIPAWPDNSNSTGDNPAGAASMEIYTARVALGGSAMFRVWDAVLSAENCQPANGAVDPGELVTVDIALQNTGSGDVFNLEATLLPTGGVLQPDGPQNYGYIAAGDPEVARPYTFLASGECGGTLTLTLELRDGGASFGTVTFPLPLGRLSTSGRSFSNAAPVIIQDDNEAIPYPSEITVSGLAGPVTNVSVTLHRFIHTYPADVDILLTGPGGQAVMLMSDAGAGHNVDATITFEDGAPALPQVLPLAAGRYAPGNLADPLNPSDPLPFPAPEAPYATSLATFAGSNPNGTWRLYAFDDSGSDAGEIAGGWSLNFVSTEASCCDPPPRLRIEAANGEVEISWPSSSGAAYLLEGRASLSPAHPWTTVGQTPILGDGTYSVILPATNPARFFRLRR